MVVVSWPSTIQVCIVIGIHIFIFIFGLGVTNILYNLLGAKPNTSCIPVGWVFIYSCLVYASMECIRKRDQKEIWWQNYQRCHLCSILDASAILRKAYS